MRKRFRLLKQRKPDDCAICSIAMATGLTYTQVMKAALACEAYQPGKGTSHAGWVLDELGFEGKYKNGEPVGDYSARCRMYPVAPEYFRDMAWGRKALMSVPSLNLKNGMHMIYWDGKKVRDPSPKKTYKLWQELKPEGIVLFREGLV